MSSYRHRPLVIEAFQLTQKAMTDHSDWPDWLERAWNTPAQEKGAVYILLKPGRPVNVNTLGGPYHVRWNDYVIRGINGELSVLPPDIFYSSYDKA